MRGLASSAAGALAALFVLSFLPPREASAFIGRKFPAPNPNRSFVINATFTSARCSAKYSCSDPLRLSDATECSCHDHCWLHDTCCADAPHADWRDQRLAADSYACLDAYAFTAKGLRYFQTVAGAYYGAYAVTSCADDFPISLLDDLCLVSLENATDASDAALASPVTDPKTGATYRNIFCAGCNGLLPAGVLEWTPFRSCNTLGPDASKELCPLAFAPPENASLHACYADVVATCANSDNNSEDICRDSPTSYVYDTANRTVYRNWNCTLCNTPPPAESIQCAAWPRIPLTLIPVEDFNYPADVVRNYHCPEKVGFPMSEKEQTFWISLCPGVFRDNYEQYSTAVNETAVNESAVNESAVNDTAVNETVVNETAVNETAVNETAVNETTVNETAVNETAVNETAVNETTVNESAVNKSAVNKSAVNESAVNESAVNESAVNETAVNESAVA